MAIKYLISFEAKDGSPLMGEHFYKKREVMKRAKFYANLGMRKVKVLRVRTVHKLAFKQRRKN